jgi:prepilin peptidase CpaA
LIAVTTLFWANQFLIFCFFAMIIFAAINDAARFRIPNAVSLGLIILFPPHVLVSPVPIDWLRSLMMAGLVFGAGFILFSRGLMGGGDVKLLTAAALWAGAGLLLPLLVVMGLVGGVLAALAWLLQYARRYRAGGIVGLLMRDPAVAAPKVPYGVAIAAGAGYAGIQLLAR